MNKTLPLSLALTLLLIGFQKSALGSTHIIIDPGHGGYDHGAVDQNTKESHLALQVSKKIAKLLESDAQFKVSLTRQNDTHLSLKQRAQIANESKGDLFLSVHVNASPDKRAKGAEVFFQNQLHPDEESMFLANRENTLTEEGPEEKLKDFNHANPYVENILNDLAQNKRIDLSSQLARSVIDQWKAKRKKDKYVIRQAPFYVISNVTMPSALVELGFITNSKERLLLQSDEYQEKLAESIYRGIIRYTQELTN